MPKSITCQRAKRVDGRIELHFNSKVLDFADAADLGAFVDAAYDTNESLLQGLLIRWARKTGNWQSALGKTITIDFDEPNGNIVRVT